MSDITITNGLPANSPWTLANSDATKLDQANLINLAVGQLALLGASQGQTLQAQTGVLKELIGGVETVNKQLDFLSSVNSTPNLWAGNPKDLGFSDSTIGWEPSGTSDAKYILSSTDITTVETLITATKKMKELNINYGGDDAFKYNLTVASGRKEDFISRPILNIAISNYNSNASGFPMSSVVVEDAVTEQLNTSLFKTGQIFKYKQFQKDDEYFIFLSASDGGPGIAKYSLDSFIIPDKLEYFAIPQSKDEIISWQLQVPGNLAGVSSAKLAITNTDILNSQVELAPNTLPATDPPTKPPATNAVKLGINIDKDLNFAEYTLLNNSKVYASYPPSIISQDTKKYTLEDVGKVLSFTNGSKSYISMSPYGVFKATDVTNTVAFVKNIPTKDQILDWKSQYAEKIIVVTQRSSDQQLFVNNLAQKYQYAFDAATYVLKAFTAMLSSVANNV